MACLFVRTLVGVVIFRLWVWAGVIAAVPDAAARVGGGRALAPLGGAGAVRERELSSDGWRRSCWCGIWLSVAQWELQSGVCVVICERA